MPAPSLDVAVPKALPRPGDGTYSLAGMKETALAKTMAMLMLVVCFKVIQTERLGDR